jgi:hypothetical protein
VTRVLAVVAVVAVAAAATAMWLVGLLDRVEVDVCGMGED